MSVDAVGTVRRGRGARKVARQTRDIKMLPPLKRKLPLTEPMTTDQIEKIDARFHGHPRKRRRAISG